jgi:hypothetical protein
MNTMTLRKKTSFTFLFRIINFFIIVNFNSSAVLCNESGKHQLYAVYHHKILCGNISPEGTII